MQPSCFLTSGIRLICRFCTTTIRFKVYVHELVTGRSAEAAVWRELCLYELYHNFKVKILTEKVYSALRLYIFKISIRSTPGAPLKTRKYSLIFSSPNIAEKLDVISWHVATVISNKVVVLLVEAVCWLVIDLHRSIFQDPLNISLWIPGKFVFIRLMAFLSSLQSLLSAWDAFIWRLD